MLPLLLPLCATAALCGPVSTSPIAQSPVQGDELIGLLGLPERAPRVQDLLDWMGGADSDPRDGWYVAHGLTVSLSHGRVYQINLRVRRSSNVPLYTGELPLGLKRDTKIPDVQRSWQRQEDRREFKTILSRPVGTERVGGYQVTIRFDNVTLERSVIEQVRMKADLRAMQDGVIAAVQKQLPLTDFRQEEWLNLVGGDLAEDRPAMLTACVGLPYYGLSEEATREGLTVERTFHNRIKRIAFGSEFPGSRPLGLSSSPTIEEVTEKLGAPSESQEGSATWVLPSPDNFPARLHIAPGTGTPIVLTRPDEEQKPWDQLMDAAAMVGGVKRSIRKIWRRAKKHDETLLGRKEVTQGLLGATTLHHCTELIADQIGGTIQDLDGLSPARRYEFILARRRGNHAGTPENLAKSFARDLEHYFRNMERKETLGKDGTTWTIRWSEATSLGLFAAQSATLEARKVRRGVDLHLILEVALPE